MAKYLPDYKYADGIKKTYQNKFYGYNHTLSCEDGEIWDEKNMSSDHFPVMAPRQRRYIDEISYPNPIGYDRTYAGMPIILTAVESVHGDANIMAYVGGNRIQWYNNYPGIVRQIVWLNHVAVIVPDMKAILLNQEVNNGPLSVVYTSGGYDTLCATGADFEADYMPGDTVTIYDPNISANNVTAEIQTIYYNDGNTYLGFEAGTLTAGTSTGVYITCGKPVARDLGSSTGEIYVLFMDGTYAGQPAEGNTIYHQTIDFNNYFKVGDAVTISGAFYDNNNQTIIIREIQNSGHKLVFYENSFTTSDTPDEITISRTVPELEYICEDDNRLWGCAGNTIYASKLGDPFNWNVFDGLDSDSYAIEVGSSGAFTACYSYQGYPTFFKEDRIYKIYGTLPSNYELTDTMTLGVELGSDRSLAVAGEVLFYKARPGIMAYTGGAPKLVSEAMELDNQYYRNAVGGSDGIKYYVSVTDNRTGMGDNIFVYDTRYSIWHREDNVRVLAWAYVDGSMIGFTDIASQSGNVTSYSGYQFIENGETYTNKSNKTILFTGTIEPHLNSYVEFGDFVSDDPNKKQVNQVQYRCSVPTGGNMKWSISYDGSAYEDIKDSATHSADTPACDKRTFARKVTPHRVDNYRLKITGTGAWRLWTLSRDESSGSELQKH